MVLTPHGRVAVQAALDQVSPRAALASMTRVFADESGQRLEPAALEPLQSLGARHETILPWSDDDLSRGREILGRLSRDPSWWVRLYVAATLEKTPDLATPSLQARLADDRDPLVRSVFP